MPKGVAYERYTAEFKQKVVEAVIHEGLSYRIKYSKLRKFKI
jgi:transposase-like protein